MVFNDEINEIEGNVDKNMTETYERNNGNSGSNSKRSKLISFSINNRSDYSEQLTKDVMMIPSVFNDDEICDVLSLLTETYDHSDGNSSSNFKYPKLISLTINNRSGHYEQFTKTVMMIQNIFDDAEISDVLRY